MITVKEMIASADFSQITPSYNITFRDFLVLTNSKLGDYSLYQITKEGVLARDVGDLSSCTVQQASNIYEFDEIARLEFPSTAANLLTWIEKQNGEFELPEKFVNAVTTSTRAIVNRKKTETINTKEMWLAEARKQGEIYIKAWRNAGYEPTISDTGLYVEGVFSNNGTHNTNGNVIDRATIVREALTGITGHKKGYKSKLSKIPHGKTEQLPEK